MNNKNIFIDIIDNNKQEIVSMRYNDYIAKINVSEGANLFLLKNESKNADIILSKDDPLARHIDFPLFGMPVLFPPNRIANGKFQANGIEYQFPINDCNNLQNHLHGLLYFEKWYIAKKTVNDDFCSVSLGYTADENAKFYSYFPHRFKFEIDFILSDRGIEINITVCNMDKAPLPFGLGFHTFFNIPFNKYGSAKKCSITVTAGKEWLLDKDYIPTGELIELSKRLSPLIKNGFSLYKNQITNHFTAKPVIRNGKEFNGAVITDSSVKQKVVYEVGQEFGHWMLWNGKGNEGFICPEPQTVAANGFNMKNSSKESGFLMLEPNQTFKTSKRIYLED